jgi:hypothetical protein
MEAKSMVKVSIVKVFLGASASGCGLLSDNSAAAPERMLVWLYYMLADGAVALTAILADYIPHSFFGPA